MSASSSDPFREQRVTSQMYRILQGTDDAPRSLAIDEARAAFRKEVYAIAEDVDPDRKLALRERALKRFQAAVTREARKAAK
ncbi:MAG: hypothetical protein QM756_44720 [Polyangiaceae bacterium]